MSWQLRVLALAYGAVFSAFSAPVKAEFIDLPVKWSQPIVDAAGGPIPDLKNPAQLPIFGRDHLSNHGMQQVLADDFISDGRPVVAVRWWGSYLTPNAEPVIPPQGFVVPFDISFHLSTANPPGTPPHPFSLPLPEPLYLDTVKAQEAFAGVDQFGVKVFRYDAYLPQPFFEQQGVEYFIDIDRTPLPNGENVPWGWHETTPLVLDMPAIAPTHLGPWANYQEAQALAFELMVPEPESYVMMILGICLVGWQLRRRSLRAAAHRYA